MKAKEYYALVKEGIEAGRNHFFYIVSKELLKCSPYFS